MRVDCAYTHFGVFSWVEWLRESTSIISGSSASFLHMAFQISPVLDLKTVTGAIHLLGCRSAMGSEALHLTHIWKLCAQCQRGSPARYEYWSIKGPWSHVSTCIALLATSPGHIGDRKEVAEQKHSRCSSSVGHQGTLLPTTPGSLCNKLGGIALPGYLSSSGGRSTLEFLLQ